MIFSEADLKKYNALGERFVEEFNQVGHDGRLTLAENMADNAGLFAAYESAFNSKKPGTKLERQSFFIQYAKTWCTSITDERKKLFLKTDPHALPEARVNQPLKHSSAFSEAFDCAEGSKMRKAAKDQLRIW